MDLTDICGFPQTEQELLYVGPGFRFPLTPEQISHSLMNRFEPTVVIEEDSGKSPLTLIYITEAVMLVGLATSLSHRVTGGEEPMSFYCMQ
ncbi:hypothetical protein P4H83_04710 [Paenibacillus favisporus]|uniref:hypothetical protein n=1 Tax=Paenibacillus favisporus TaxID=221028 RepID=UPI002DB6F6FA|nr:hypothetical protein [Paenibacillus favisporus]MEC0174174.1 hypothetical protein [Paenibacillus favisporus]